MPKLKPIVAAAAALTLPAAAADAARQPPPLLKGTVGPSATISLKTAAGKRVRVLRAGRYRIRVTDRARDHNFRIRGPRLNRELTGVAFTGRRTVTVRLRAGRYTFVCDPHAFDMRGSFRVR